MTEMAQEINPNQNISGEQTQNVNNAPENPVTVPQTEEKKLLFTQSEISGFLGKAKREAAERERKRIFAEYGNMAPAENYSPPIPQQNGESTREIIARETQQYLEQLRKQAQAEAETAEAHRIANNVKNKLESGRQKYNDFDEVTSSIALKDFPYSVQMLSDYVDNAHDVLYELAKDPYKAVQLELMAKNGYGNQAISQMRKLSTSIKDKESAQQVKFPNEPLSQIKAKDIGSSGGKLSEEKMTASDWRRIFNA